MKNLKLLRILSYIATGMLFIFSFQANAGIVIYGTRIIYPSNKKEISVKAENTGELPALAQVSIDDGKLTENWQENNVPFFITPPISRIEAKSGQVFRIINADLNGKTLPQDRESIFYFNLLDIPPLPPKEDGKNIQYVQLSILNKIKLFYRPTGLLGNSADAPQTIQWRMNGDILKISNPSAYHVSFADIFIKKFGKVYSIDFPMINPKSEIELNFNEVAKTPPSMKVEVDKYITSEDNVYFYYLNDDGVTLPFQNEITREKQDKPL